MQRGGARDKGHGAAMKRLFTLQDDLDHVVNERAMIHGKGEHPKHRLMRYHDFFIENIADGQRVIDSISRTLAEQPQLEIRLEALERAHREIRDEVAHLFDGEVDERAADPGLVGSSWFRAGLWVRAGLVALILVIVAIVSVPYFIDWWQAMIQPRHG